MRAAPGGLLRRQRRAKRDPATRDTRGVVTAETALALPVLVGLAVGLVWLLALGLQQVLLIDAARETARAVARGESTEAALALGERVAPRGSRLAISTSGDRVTVVAQVQPGAAEGWWAALPTPTLRAESVALREEGAAP